MAKRGVDGGCWEEIRAYWYRLVNSWQTGTTIIDMTVSVTEAKNRLSQLLTAVEKGECVRIERHGQVIAEIVKPTAKRVPRFWTLKGVVYMTPEQFHEATRPMTEEEVDSFLEGGYDCECSSTRQRAMWRGPVLP
jgi:antitoxin (DNA-binding transcriptional repressor) of toxin-antitoxin stability system